MARLQDLISNKTTTATTTDLKESLVYALETLIEMVKDNALTTDEVKVLDEAVEFIANSEEELSEKKMSAKALMHARQYRLKNKGKLAMIAKRKARCAAKIAGKEGFACNSMGMPHKVDKARSKASMKGARSR